MKTIDKKMKDQGYIPVTNWLNGKKYIFWLYRESSRLNNIGMPTIIKTINGAKCLYRKMTDEELMNIKLYDYLFNPNITKIASEL